jgi:carboxymethylenebutenolidase
MQRLERRSRRVQSRLTRALAVTASLAGLFCAGTGTAAAETFTSAGKTYNITVYPGPADGKRYPMILVLHGNAGLNPPFGAQIQDFAKTLAGNGYVTAVPQYYPDDEPHLFDADPHPKIPTLVDAVRKIAGRADADAERLGLVGYSLGAAIAMTYVASNTGEAKVLVDFFGPINSTIETGVGNFPPTIILHNKKDLIVNFQDSSARLDELLPTSVEHLLVDYEENFQEQGHHPFRPGGHADSDSRKKATDWVIEHLPPTGE